MPEMRLKIVVLVLALRLRLCFNRCDSTDLGSALTSLVLADSRRKRDGDRFTAIRIPRLPNGYSTPQRVVSRSFEI